MGHSTYTQDESKHHFVIIGCQNQQRAEAETHPSIMTARQIAPPRHSRLPAFCDKFHRIRCGPLFGGARTG
ncbi:MAG: hypothetical protein DMF06_17540 [Verrucomicrobia bacterium]|nr:MAG: hypothetical protein DMF06_17540 [Verrucomicrobiota bacterium]